jgi:hypothetical protein
VLQLVRLSHTDITNVGVQPMNDKVNRKQDSE